MWLGDWLVKRFRQPANNQRAILEVFEEEGWPSRIDDPLPGDGEIGPRQRLHDAIKLLNRNQHAGRIRFRGDGLGTGVLWEVGKNGEGAEHTGTRKTQWAEGYGRSRVVAVQESGVGISEDFG